jgi:general secretion pathway protein I
MPRTDRDSRGFTLLEVLIGFTVAALMMTVLLQAFTRGLASSDRSARYSAAVLTAQSTLDRVGLASTLREATADTTTADGFRVATLIHRYGEPAAGDPTALYAIPYEIAVTVAWREGRQERALSLRSIRLGSPPLQ